MATKNQPKGIINPSAAFLTYQESIISHPNFKGMPDIYKDDKTIQWEAPSNRSSGKFQFTHDNRLKWWEKKAKEIGVDVNSNHWISKVAKEIHPTKKKPCKVCGRIMDIRYCYLGANLIKRIEKLHFYNFDLELNNTTHVEKFIEDFTDLYGEEAFDSLPQLFKCKQVNNIPHLKNDAYTWCEWIRDNYIPLEPKGFLSPGAMSNAPDRLDGFHTFNICCRSTADKGRSKENLASYTSDRRAFELWTDGNWIVANKLMGRVNSDKKIQKYGCANNGISLNNDHSSTVSADHIGPISLGFSHREEFQLLCNSCNSAKNNRMNLTDVEHLIEQEKKGINIVSWYAEPIWNLCKHKVTDSSTAVRLSRIMRDNRGIALSLINFVFEQGYPLFLLTLLNLEYADYTYAIIDYTVSEKNIITSRFNKKPSDLQYVTNQKVRKIRIAFESIVEYANKDNRNTLEINDSEIESLKSQLIKEISTLDFSLKEKNAELYTILTMGVDKDNALKSFITNYNTQDIIAFQKGNELMIKIMEKVAKLLEKNWDSPRYSREIE
ncbi:TPA: Alw26I/Eco31I/Esp3I family type II restriction endonuclease [Streptococcus suis]